LKHKTSIYVSATPADYELQKTEAVVEQVIRPTGLLDPVVKFDPLNQIDDLLKKFKARCDLSKSFRTTYQKEWPKNWLNT
jgi:excinuclease ABC subunit B